MRLITRYWLKKKKSSYFAPETTTPGYVSSKKRKNRPKMCKVLPNSTNISQKYRKPFLCHAMCVCVHAWSFFRKDVYWIPKEYSVAHVLPATGGWKKRCYGSTTSSSIAWKDPPPSPPSQEFATKLIENSFSATECLGLALHYKCPEWQQSCG